MPGFIRAHDGALIAVNHIAYVATARIGPDAAKTRHVLAYLTSGAPAPIASFETDDDGRAILHKLAQSIAADGYVADFLPADAKGWRIRVRIDAVVKHEDGTTGTEYADGWITPDPTDGTPFSPTTFPKSGAEFAAWLASPENRYAPNPAEEADDPDPETWGISDGLTGSPYQQVMVIWTQADPPAAIREAMLDNESDAVAWRVTVSASRES